MVVVGANGSNAIDIRNFDGVAVTRRVQFAVPAVSLFVVVSRAVAAVHTVCMSLLAILAFVASEPTLAFEGGAFNIVVPGSETKIVVRISPEPSPVTGDKFKVTLNGVLITFDQRGLGIQYRGKGGFSGLTYVPKSGKAFSAQEIVANSALIAAGHASERVAALSGFEIFGDTVYLLARWQRADGAPWFEAIVSIDASAEEPVTRLIARVQGLTRAQATIEDRLYAGSSGIVAPLFDDSGAMTAVIGVPSGEVNYKRFPVAPASLLHNGLAMYDLETTDYGTQILSRYRDGDLAKSAIFESRGSLVDIGVDGVLLENIGAETRLLSLKSGALMPIAADSGVKTIPLGTLVWEPKSQPKSARLYDRGGWTVLARWSASK